MSRRADRQLPVGWEVQEQDDGTVHVVAGKPELTRAEASRLGARIVGASIRQATAEGSRRSRTRRDT